jgi:hypothetical protein
MEHKISSVILKKILKCELNCIWMDGRTGQFGSDFVWPKSAKRKLFVGVAIEFGSARIKPKRKYFFINDIYLTCGPSIWVAG